MGIPKIIHYCWFGSGAKPALVKRCMETWRQFLPDWEIREWNEASFDVQSVPFVRQAWEARKYAFVSDFVRLHALETVGGVYLDTDIELLQGLDGFLDHPCFLGYEGGNIVATAVMGAQAGHQFIRAFKDLYRGRQLDLVPNTHLASKLLEDYPVVINKSDCLVREGGIHIYPADVFSPLSFESQRANITPSTVAIHHFSGSWLPFKSRLRIWLKRRLGIDLARMLHRGRTQ